MTSKSIPTAKHILKYGILFGIASILFGVTTYLTGNYTKQGLIHLIILLVITLSSIMAGLLMFKKNNNGYISLGEALKISIGITLLGGFMAILWKVMLLNVIDPEIITQIEDKHIKRIAENSADFTQENIERKIAITKKYTSPLRMILIALAEDLFNGSLFGLIGGLIIRKKRDPFN
ncbi:DUF4199 domain-containing protein [Aquimarina sp. SS2-1]|uniref:DUF4199 domain-containing protein n=1 Tax=Aquimarina besae TaxID=3342247 RepID=UPI00366BCBCE